jgi:methionyl-tRNA formyltransferase
MKTIAYLGTKEIGAECLNILLQEIATGYPARVEYVATNNRSLSLGGETVSDIAGRYSIPCGCDAKFILDQPSVDLIVSVQFHQILKMEHIHKAKDIAVNYHMAPLPEYRGCNQFSYAIINQDTEFGTTLHQLEEGIDCGAIIAERRFPISNDIFVQELYNKTFHETQQLFKETFKSLLEGTYTLRSQSEFKDRKNSIHYRNDIHKLKNIDWRWPKERIERYIRATSMPGFPPCYTTIHGKVIEFITKPT